METGTNEIKQLDRQNMLGKLKDFPEQCKTAYSIPIPESLCGKEFHNIILCGMGGSAIGGGIIKALSDEYAKLPCIVNRDYTLPAFAGSKTLVIAASYSGNTEETLSALEEGHARGCSLVCISSGGKMEQTASEANIPFIKIPGGYPPRCAFGYLFFPCSRLLSEMGIIANFETELFGLIEKWTGSFLPEKKDNAAMAIASEFHGRVPLIYSSSIFHAAVERWKTQIAENSKAFAFINTLPEMNHNEIMAWHHPLEFIERALPVFVLAANDHERTRLRMEITAKILSGLDIDCLKLQVSGEKLIEKILYLVVLGDWVSFYLAVLNGVDPTEITEITILKQEMGGK